MEAEQPPVAVPSKKDYSKVTLNNLPAPEIKTTRDLSVIFIYNGHSWNAFEVLGVPAGAALRDVTDAYQIALRKAEKESHEFLTCAYQSILSQRSRL